MKNQFSILAFCGKVPLELLEEYLTDVGVCRDGWGSCIPWDTLGQLPLDRRGLSIIKQAIVEAPETIRDQVLQDLTDVNALASDCGMAQLVTTGALAPTPVDVTACWGLHDGYHARALAVRCRWPTIFRRAVMHYRIHGIAAHRWYRTGRLEGAQPTFSERAQEHLREAISHYFVQQGRGRGCAVTVETRGEDIYTFVYPEDAPQRLLAFDETHTIIVETMRPALEIIFVWHGATQTVDCFATCPQPDRRAALQRFGRIILDVDFFPDVPRLPVFKLEALKFRGYPFPVHREDEVLSVRVLRLRLAHRKDPEKHRVTVETVNPMDPDSLYTYMEEKLRLAQSTVQDMLVEEAHLKILFRGKTPSHQPVSRTVTLAMPDVLRLGRNDKYYPTIRTLLRRWQLDVAHTVAVPVFGAGK